MIDIGIQETTTTSGTGAVTLSAVAGKVRVADAFAVGDPVTYTIINGENMESGVGTVGAGNTLSRDVIVKTLVAGVLTDGGSAISLAGASDVVVTQHHATPQGDAGLVPVGITQRWMPNAANGTNLATITVTANRGYFMPFVPGFTMGAFGSLGVEVSTALAGTAYVAIFESKLVGANLLPGRRIYQTAALDTGTTGEKFTAAMGARFKAGHVYWLALTASSACAFRAVAVGGLNNLLGFVNVSTASRSHIYATQSGAFGADASGLTYTGGVSNVPAVMLAP